MNNDVTAWTTLRDPDGRVIGYGLYEPLRTIEWFVTWPDERAPDAVTVTIREAKAAFAAAVEEAL